jgi:hypothetical protein
MRQLPVLAASLLVAGLAAAEPLTVVVLGGQSNMEGQAKTADLDPAYRTQPEGIAFINLGKPAQLAAGTKFGPEVGFAHAIAKARPGRRFLLVKWAVGGTSMAVWGPQQDVKAAQASPIDSKQPHLYAKLRDATLAAVKEQAADQPRVAAFLWMQGEADCRREELGPRYGTNFPAMIAAFRKDLDAAQAPFLFGRINPPEAAKDEKTGGPRYPYRAQVRAAQEQTAKDVPGAILIETDDLSKLGDNLHYDAKGLLEMGRRMAEAFLKAVP